MDSNPFDHCSPGRLPPRTGNIATLTITETLDVCATVLGTEYCGADIKDIPGVGSAAANTLNNPPWTLTEITAGFEEACASAPAATYKVTTAFTLSGSLADYGVLEQASIKAALAAAAGTTVAASDISLTLTAGSVIVAAEITAPNQAAATTISTALSNGLLANPTAMQTALALVGVSTTVSAITPPTVVASSGVGGGTGAGVVIVIVSVVLLVLSAIAFGVAVKFKKLPLKVRSSTPLVR